MIHSPRYRRYCETWVEMQKLRDEGLVNTIGVSNFEIDDLERIYQKTGEYPAINQRLNFLLQIEKYSCTSSNAFWWF